MANFSYFEREVFEYGTTRLNEEDMDNWYPEIECEDEDD